MGRNSSDYSESPVRNHRSSRRSPSRRERSPAQHRSSYSARSPGREKPSSRTKSPRRAKSPITHSPVREKPSTHSRSSKHTRSRSPLDRLPVKEAPSSRTRSPVQPSTKSPGSRSPSPRSKRLRRDRSNHKDDKSNEKGHDKNHGKTRSPARPNSRSPESRSPSPRTRRLRRAEADKTSDRGHERNHNSGGDRARRKERDPEREVPIERRDRKSGRDTEDNGSSKSRHVSSISHAEHHRSRHRSHSPSAATGARDEGNNSKEDDHRNGDDDSVARMKAAEEALETKEKQKPSFELSGKLAAETNRVKGVTLLFTEPPDARKPEIRWRLYVFKGGEVLNEPLYVHRQTCYLFGRERRVADIPTDHPSCSKQHAVLQYRQVEKEQPDGMLKKEIRPYIMDLGSTNGTFINDNRIDPERYYELMEKDTIKFGNSSREYVLLHENSA
ncbi:FHA domain-containing protein DDL [Cynara cardunculus var. scolymus]|uniref:FHA domain-containing protein DDL n=1 Tax=Cynara cardunculus var. scolymus TaxID=59895 RepID=UPI000D623825|nr:FHA domain-containing protein DDL [Cynara cardunculus var. scolymus]XP_024976781.1 FHA domain-containing protein DDL [Cynara cardunculus var. scolymus]